MDQQIYFAADHGGFARKEMLKAHLQTKGYTLKDFGADHLDAQDDYPDFVYPMAEAVAKHGALGLALCRNAQGVCIVANKVDGIRAALGHSVKAAISSKKDDNANVLCIPGDELTDEQAIKIVDAWIIAEFSGAPRHLRRLSKIENIEKK